MKYILIVDDDAFFASTFQNNFSWQNYGFYTPVYAESGQKAIELLQQKEYAFAFIDMSMPSMSGPQLIEYVQTYYPKTVCISLSNYDDFDFVKESFRAGAKDYILKHCLNKNEIQKQLEKFTECQKVPLQKTQSSHDHVSEYLSALLKGKYRYSSKADSSQILGINLAQGNLLLIRLEITDYQSFRHKNNQLGKQQYILRNICSIMQNILDRHCSGIVFYLQEDDAVFSLLSDEKFSDIAFLEHTRELYNKQVINSLKLYFNVDCQCITAPLCSDIRDISYAYKDILKQLNLDIPHSNVHLAPMDLEQVRNRGMKSVPVYLQYLNFDNLRRYIAQEYEKGRKLHYSLAQFAELTTVLYDIYSHCRKEFAPDTPLMPSDISKIVLMTQVQDMEASILELFTDLHHAVQEHNTLQHSKYIDNALKIIHRQYSNSALSLNLIAEILHINASYLSRTFKSEVGIGVSEYINNHRIKRAKDLLTLEHLTVKETAEQCGFESYTYFFRVFKRITGVTPKEYLDGVNL